MNVRFRRFARVVSAGALGLVIAVIPSTLRAQQHGGHYHDELVRGRPDGGARVELGGGLGVSVPQGDFGFFTGEGISANLHAVFPVERSGAVGIRLDGGFINYGSERFSVPFLPVTGRVGFDVRTRNNIAMFGIGPQLQVPRGSIRPFINGYVGMGYFFTESSLGDGPVSIGSTLNYDDWSLGYGFGGGVGVELTRRLLLTFETQYRMHDNVQYLREGGIIDDGYGGVILDPILSDADFLVFQVGVSWGF